MKQMDNAAAMHACTMLASLATELREALLHEKEPWVNVAAADLIKAWEQLNMTAPAIMKDIDAPNPSIRKGRNHNEVS